MATVTAPTEEILSEVSNRFVLFPIRYNAIWNMYKKAESVFWTAEELDLSKDLSDWEKLSENERHFVKHILAFFAGSDGIVNENLGVRFMNEVKPPEAKAFYGFQIAMENIHCVGCSTKVITRTGHTPIMCLAGKTTDVWNGRKWVNVTPYKTGSIAELFRVTLSNGLYLDCTEKHRWYIMGYEDPVLTKDLFPGMHLLPYTLPNNEVMYEDPDIFSDPELHGTNAGSSQVRAGSSNNFRPSCFVPLNYTTPVKLRWLKGLRKSATMDSTNYIFHTPYLEFARDLQLLLLSLSIYSTSLRVEEEMQVFVSKVDLDQLIINNNHITFKMDLRGLEIKSIHKLPGQHPTYCFEDPDEHSAVFNGILTGQSETYSLLIDTYIKDQNEKYRLLNAINTIPCITKKADWALRWISDKDSSFATRLVAFACVEGIFFSGAFCAIFWLKERGVMPGLCTSNEFISRDEGLHTEFAILLYSMLQNKLSQDTIYEIVKEAVEIEDEFINERIPCHLLGMNADLMSQYIKFVADRLVVQLGYEKIWNVSNPFAFMDRICLENKTNFFEERVAQYSKANVGAAPGTSNFEFATDEDF
jgi:ribonucleotide reductase beta subunit family protein with ferritin-like domain